MGSVLPNVDLGLSERGRRICLSGVPALRVQATRFQLIEFVAACGMLVTSLNALPILAMRAARVCRILILRFKC